jgi:hypothetical protein
VGALVSFAGRGSAQLVRPPPVVGVVGNGAPVWRPGGAVGTLLGF